MRIGTILSCAHVPCFSNALEYIFNVFELRIVLKTSYLKG